MALALGWQERAVPSALQHRALPLQAVGSWGSLAPSTGNSAQLLWVAPICL